MRHSLVWALVLLCTSAAVAGEVRLTSAPPGARVYKGTYNPQNQTEGLVGITPLMLDLDPAYSYRFWFVLPGYTPVEQPLANGQDHLDVLLSAADPLTWVRHQMQYRPALAYGTLVALMGIGGAAGWLLRRRTHTLQAQVVDAEVARAKADERWIGDYQVFEPLGEGAFASVFRAKHRTSGQTYALKLLKTEEAGGGMEERFAREMEIGRQLQHSNLVLVHDMGTHEGAPYLVMDLVRGTTLEDRLKAGPLSVSEALAIINQVCDGLSVAHQNQIMHRDLKPGNIMLAEDGGVRILDFGMAHTSGSNLTETGSSIGTVPYMSPEHARDAKLVDERSEVYSLGCILFEMLSGRTVFVSPDPMQILMSQITDTPPAIRTLVADVPAELEEIIAKMLQKKPAKRFQSLRELQSELQKIG